MSLRYVIDGYNLVNNDSFRKLAEKNADCRISLLEYIRLNGICGSKSNRVIVIFDGYPPYSPFTYEHSNFEVIFSCDITADQKIKDILEKSEDTKNVVVVSNDKEICFFARQCRAQAKGVEDFLKKPENKVSQADKSQSSLTYTQAHNINEELRKKWLK